MVDIVYVNSNQHESGLAIRAWQNGHTAKQNRLAAKKWDD
jgi:hypothetical protein